MPRVRRVAKRRRDYTSQEIKLLLTGVSLTTRFGALHKGMADMKAMREAWEDLRGELLPTWITERPFTRPISYWLFDAKEPRLQTVGEQRMEAEQASKTEERDFCGGYFRGLNQRLGQADERDAHTGKWETQKQYLCRLNLLTDGERALL